MPRYAGARRIPARSTAARCGSRHGNGRGRRTEKGTEGSRLDDTEIRREPLGAGIVALTTKLHGFGADAVLLADFASPRQGERLCDLCAGCGIVSLLWCRRGPFDVDAVELRPEAASLARRAAEENRLGSLHVLEADLRTLPHSINGSYDLVACNPPYRPMDSGPASVLPEQRDARFESACTLQDAVASGSRLLKNGGKLCLCHRPERLADLLALMRASGTEPKRLRFAQYRPDSAPWLVLAEGKKGAKPGLRVEPSLLLYDREGAPSPECRRIYNLDPAV